MIKVFYINNRKGFDNFIKGLDIKRYNKVNCGITNGFWWIRFNDCEYWSVKKGE